MRQPLVFVKNKKCIKITFNLNAKKIENIQKKPDEKISAADGCRYLRKLCCKQEEK